MSKVSMISKLISKRKVVWSLALVCVLAYLCTSVSVKAGNNVVYAEESTQYIAAGE